MDTITQGLLGAVCGQALYADKLGWKRAAAWGAVGGLIPDLDVVPIAFMGPLAEFRLHRVATHSLWFPLVAGPLLGWAAWRLSGRDGSTAAPAVADGAGATTNGGARAPAARTDDAGSASRGSARDPGGLAAWIGLFVVALVTHPLLDLFTTYGTTLLWPMPHRFALDAVAIVDPVYSSILVAALLVGRLARGPRGVAAAQVAGLGALVLTTAFLFYGLHLNQQAEAEARRQLATQAGDTLRVRAYPTLFQPWLRRIVARSGDDVYVGLLSTWKPHPVRWGRFSAPRDARIEAARGTPEGTLFEWFAMGETAARVVEEAPGAGLDSGRAFVEIDDLRYGYGERPEHGLWGLRIPLDERGRPAGPAVRFNRRPRAALVSAFGLLWRATFDPGA